MIGCFLNCRFLTVTFVVYCVIEWNTRKTIFTYSSNRRSNQRTLGCERDCSNSYEL